MAFDLRTPIPFEGLECQGDMDTSNLAVNRSNLIPDISNEKSSEPKGSYSGKTNPRSSSPSSIGVLCSSDISDI